MLSDLKIMCKNKHGINNNAELGIAYMLNCLIFDRASLVSMVKKKAN